MDQQEQRLIRTYMESLQVEVLTVGHTRVSPLWVNKNVAPPFSCLYLIEDGTGWVKIKGEDYNPESGQLVILPAGIVHSYSSSSAAPYLKYWCHLNAKVGELHLFHLIDVPLVFPVGDFEAMAQKFRGMLAEWENPSLLSPLAIKTTMLEIIMEIIRQNLPDRVRLIFSHKANKLNEIIGFIEENLADELSVDRLADLAGYSPKYFNAFFKSLLGVTPIQYINKARVERAKRLLLTTDMNVTEIAGAIGLEPHYFSRMFKLYTDFSPGSFRNFGRSPASPECRGSRR